MEISISILYRKMAKMPLMKEEEELFDKWYSEREEHRVYWERFCRQQEKIQERQKSIVNVEVGLVRLKRDYYKVRRRMIWMRVSVAVSIFILMGLIVSFLYQPRQKFYSQVEHKSVIEQENVVLKLSDGKNIVLQDSSTVTTLHEKEAFIQIETGRLHYQMDSVLGDVMAYNELKVPSAGEYQVVLTDGTKVFLNSSSILRYPVVFTGKERRVYLDGEAFFVVEHSEIPFIVETKEEEIRVFGTEFNVMTYAEEKQMQATLVRGSIGVKMKVEPMKDYVKLIPGEQLLVDNQTREISVRKVDVFPYIAWKEGLFVSQNDDLETIMTKIARWYNVNVFYQNSYLKEKKFWGVMKKQDSLEKILEIIAKAGHVKFNVNDRTVIVTE